MDADIEHLVLSGKLFGANSRSSSPARSPSPTLSFASASDDSDPHHNTYSVPNAAHQESIGMGPGRTGVKGVIRDSHEAAALHAERRARELEDVRRRMERANLGGKTFLEEEAENAKEKGTLDVEARVDLLGLPRAGRFGHLREVGRRGFVGAVEREGRGVWVVVHLYESSLDRCYVLDEMLVRLARMYPETKFLRARAAALGFASAGTSSLRTRGITRLEKMPGRFTDDEEDPYAEVTDEKAYYDDENDGGEEDEEDEEDDVDTDMLPTMLVYRDGELVHNWVRVDWEAGPAGVEDLLARRNVISGFSSGGNCGLPEDEGDDLIWSDEEDAK